MLADYSGPRLKSLRNKARLTQMQVAEQAGVSETTLCYLEKGDRRPQGRTLQKLLTLYAQRIQYWEGLDRALNGENNAEGKIDRQTPEWRRGSGLAVPSGTQQNRTSAGVPGANRRP
ncbi:MAG: helix-turn-helix transcriptional regulator [Terriglobales bacterium]